MYSPTQQLCRATADTLTIIRPRTCCRRCCWCCCLRVIASWTLQLRCWQLVLRPLLLHQCCKDSASIADNSTSSTNRTGFACSGMLLLLLLLLLLPLPLLLPMLFVHLLLLQPLLHLPQHAMYELHVGPQAVQQSPCRCRQLLHSMQHRQRHPWHCLVLLLLLQMLLAAGVRKRRLQQLLKLLIGSS